MCEWEIVAGDAVELLRTLDDESVQLVVTSPPYPGQYGNGMTVVEWLAWAAGWMNLVRLKLAPNGVMALNVQFKRTVDGWFDWRVFHLGNSSWWPLHLLDVYVWGKTNPPPNGVLTFADAPGWEFVFIMTKAQRPEDVVFNPVRKPYGRGSVRANGKLYSNMSRRETEPHPEGARQSTLMLLSSSGDQGRPRARGISFPRALPERLIRQYTNPGDLVVDPFCGVGTTGWVARRLGRRFVGFELDAEEAERARAWLGELDLQEAS